MKPLYTATATATDAGRNGRARSSDGAIDVGLTMPEAMGGPGGAGTNPEQLFAAGYAACFANAMRSAARRDRHEEVVEGVAVTAHVDIGRIGNGFLGLAVAFDIVVPGLEQTEAEELVAKAHERCPVLERHAREHARLLRGPGRLARRGLKRPQPGQAPRAAHTAHSGSPGPPAGVRSALSGAAKPSVSSK